MANRKDCFRNFRKKIWKFSKGFQCMFPFKNWVIIENQERLSKSTFHYWMEHRSTKNEIEFFQQYLERFWKWLLLPLPLRLCHYYLESRAEAILVKKELKYLIYSQYNSDICNGHQLPHTNHYHYYSKGLFHWDYTEQPTH